MIYHAPKLLNSIRNTAGITYAKRNQFNTDDTIRGLNFGDNTDTKLPVVKRNLDVLNKELHHCGSFALAEQVHGTDISVVSKPGFYTGIDGFISKEDSLVIGVKVADCAAVLLVDQATGVLAAVHAGWRGAASGILPNSLEKMEKEGASLSDLNCYISPCISVENFEIGEEVAVQFPSRFVDRSIGSKPHLDLKGFLTHQLIYAGISESSIEIDPRCTINDTSFYSYRRERDKAGRMLAFITKH